ncbi:MAG: PIN domain-containing protein [Planctomycetota bacterium]
MRAYADADILIWHLRGERKTIAFLRGLREEGAYELWTGAMQRAEVVFFMRPGEEERTLLFLSQFKTAAVDQGLVDHAAALYRRWHPSHGLDIHDAFLAATALHTGGRIFTLNTKHYPMPDLLVTKPW